MTIKWAGDAGGEADELRWIAWWETRTGES